MSRGHDEHARALILEIQNTIKLESRQMENSLEDVYARIRRIETFFDNLVRETQIGKKTFQMSFSEALEALKLGRRVSMWNTDDIWVSLWPEEGNKLPEFRVKTMGGKFGPWTPHNGEILSNNWRILEDE